MGGERIALGHPVHERKTGENSMCCKDVIYYIKSTLRLTFT